MTKIELMKTVEFEKRFSIDDILDFARISEDNNPIHINKEHALNSIFKKRVVHGVLLVSMFSKIFGTLYPGKGAIYLGQSSKFLKPAFIGELIKAKAKLISFDDDNKKGIFSTECFNESDTLILVGEAKILFPKTFKLSIDEK
jgi:3-hydroxybutyryl-CoA dehydratase